MKIQPFDRKIDRKIPLVARRRNRPKKISPVARRDFAALLDRPKMAMAEKKRAYRTSLLLLNTYHGYNDNYSREQSARRASY